MNLSYVDKGVISEEIQNAMRLDVLSATEDSDLNHHNHNHNTRTDTELEERERTVPYMLCEGDKRGLV